MSRRPQTIPWSDLVPVGVEALWRFRLRTALSVLGVVIGVAAFVAMLSVSEGARREALRQVEHLGLRALVVRAEPLADGSMPPLRLGDAERLARLVPEAARTAAVIRRHGRAGGSAGSLEVQIIGVTADYFALRQLDAMSGRLLTAIDDGERQVCVIGRGLATRLFGGRDAVGRPLRVDARWLVVVGVLDTEGAAASDDQTVRSANHNDAVIVPIPVLFGHRQFLPGETADELWLEAEPAVEPGAVKIATERALTSVRGRSDGVRVMAAQELLAQRLGTQRIFNVVMGSIALLTLMVGGIGIMNIMLASVLERTSEIGLRRTVGATQSWILRQFVFESVTMTTAGGVAGLICGAALAAGITAYAGWPTHVSAFASVVGLVVAVGVGLVFGIYPAVRAARLQPIDAVRTE